MWLFGPRAAPLGCARAELDLDAAVARLRGAGDRPLGEALQSQWLVAGIGNMWMAEAQCPGCQGGAGPPGE